MRVVERFRMLRRFAALFVAPLLLVAGASIASAQQASFGGTVLSEAGEKPVANAEISIEGTNKTARSDSAGNFMITGLPAGKLVVMVRMLGFEALRTEVTLGASQKIEADLLIKPQVTTLSNVDVKGNKSGASPFAVKLTDFENRRKQGIGKFVTAEEFEKADGRPPSSLLPQKISGIRIVQSNGRRWIASSRGMASKTGGGQTSIGEKIPPGCYMQVILNGRVEYNGTPGQNMFDIDQLNTKDIIGLEFYTTSTTPLEYNATRGSNMDACGTVIIWTKGG